MKKRITYSENFILWLYKRKHPFIYWGKGKWCSIDNKPISKIKYNLNDIYNYWITC